VITAWLSVGVGELVAVYLILRRFNISFAIALAVILSAFTVQGAIIYHLLISKAVYWQIVIFAGAGAIIGGIIAKHVVLYFSPVKLKIFFATWVLVMGLAGLPIWMQ
ncbi:MAG: putative membrane protein YfcA, partial [Glaciecola sp.]